MAIELKVQTASKFKVVEHALPRHGVNYSVQSDTHMVTRSDGKLKKYPARSTAAAKAMELNSSLKTKMVEKPSATDQMFTVWVPIQEKIGSALYPFCGTSNDGPIGGLPDLGAGPDYKMLTQKVNELIEKRARIAGKPVEYSIFVSLMYDAVGHLGLCAKVIIKADKES